MEEKDPEHVRIGKLSKRKGGLYERKIAKLLTEGLGMGKFQKTPKSGAAAGVIYEAMKEFGKACILDLIVPKDFIFSIDCKNDSSWSFDELFRSRVRANKKSKQMFNNEDFYFEPVLIEWYKEAEMKCRKLGAKPPILIFTKNSMPDFVLVKSKYKKLGLSISLELFRYNEYTIFRLQNFIDDYKDGNITNIHLQKNPIKIKE